KITGTKKLVKQFKKMLEKRTGNKYDIDNEGYLSNIGGYSNSETTNKKSGELSDLIENINLSNKEITLDLISNSNEVFIDSYDTGEVDVSDLKILGKSSKALQAAFIGHILSERFNNPTDWSNPNNRTDENYIKSHN